MTCRCHSDESTYCIADRKCQYYCGHECCQLRIAIEHMEEGHEVRSPSPNDFKLDVECDYGVVGREDCSILSISPKACEHPTDVPVAERTHRLYESLNRKHEQHCGYDARKYSQGRRILTCHHTYRETLGDVLRRRASPYRIYGGPGGFQ